MITATSTPAEPIERALMPGFDPPPKGTLCACGFLVHGAMDTCFGCLPEEDRRLYLEGPPRPATLGALIRLYRIVYGMPIADLANRLWVPASWLEAVERGEAIFGVQMVAKLEKLFDTDGEIEAAAKVARVEHYRRCAAFFEAEVAANTEPDDHRNLKLGWDRRRIAGHRERLAAAEREMP